jgi:phage recombination protein Bet
MSNITVKNEQIELLKESVFKGLTDSEMSLAIAISNKTGLDPLLKQIFFVKRFDAKQNKEIMTAQTSLDGFRLIAARTGEYAGSDEPIFDNEEKPGKATVTVWRFVNGVRCPFTASARWAEFYPGDKVGFMWRKMPFVMLGKAAECQALRKAFPAETSQVYAPEEMEQISGGRLVAPSKAEQVQEKISPKQIEPSDAITPAEFDPTEYFETDKQETIEETPKCTLCATELKVSQSGKHLFCPNWKNQDKGIHPTVKL